MVTNQKYDMLLGSEAVAKGVYLARPAVIAAYPITPQTHIIETLAEMVESSELDAEFIKVESELSAISACFGAVAAGVRAFTATSSHGLALMHEFLHWFSGARFPMLMVNANRALGSPWNIWTDQSDSMSQRDTGWIQLYASTVQEALDFVLIGYRLTEMVMIPVMVNLDGFILSHTLEPLYIPDRSLVDRFLPPYIPDYFLDTENPRAFCAPATAENFYFFRKRLFETTRSSINVIKNIFENFKTIFGRKYNILMQYKTEDAEFIFVTSGAISGTVKVAVDKLREMGINAGLIDIKVFRPFPQKDLFKLINPRAKILVLNRSVSYGVSGTITQEIKNSLKELNIKVVDIIISLGGKVVSVENIINLVKDFEKLDTKDTIWV